MRRNSLNHKKLLISVISAFILFGSTNGNHVVNKDINNTKYINYMRSDVCEVLKQMRRQYIVKPKEKVITREENLFLISAYDLSYQSCQKSRSNKEYGITSSGFSLRGHTLQSARTIATDPTIIPTSSKVRLKFKDTEYKRFDGIYTSRDVGGRIFGKHIDLFAGDFGNYKPSKLATEFGNVICEVEIIKD